MTTFAKLGIPFALFEAPVEDAEDYVGLETCSLCGAANAHCFELGIGADILMSCATCGEIVALDAVDCEGADCGACGTRANFPVSDEAPVHCCYACLREGRAALTKDTEFGMIRFVDAVAGVTHGIPELVQTMFESVQTDDGWVGAKVPTAHMLELVRTPCYQTIQGDRWQFCCAQPMAYLGQWTTATFNRMAEDGDGEALFNAIVGDAPADLWHGGLPDGIGVYVFRCRQCGKRDALWDFD